MSGLAPMAPYNPNEYPHLQHDGVGYRLYNQPQTYTTSSMSSQLLSHKSQTEGVGIADLARSQAIQGYLNLKGTPQENVANSVQRTVHLASGYPTGGGHWRSAQQAEADTKAMLYYHKTPEYQRRVQYQQAVDAETNRINQGIQNAAYTVNQNGYYAPLIQGMGSIPVQQQSFPTVSYPSYGTSYPTQSGFGYGGHNFYGGYSHFQPNTWGGHYGHVTHGGQVYGTQFNHYGGQFI